MADLEKQGRHVPRRTREQRAYRLALTGSIAGVIGAFTLVLAIVGVMAAIWPICAIIVAVICAVQFRRTVGG